MRFIVAICVAVDAIEATLNRIWDENDAAPAEA